MGEIIFLAILGLFLGYLFLTTSSFPISVMDNSGGAAFFPRIVLGFLIALIIIRIISILFTREKSKFIIKEMFQGIRLFFVISLILYATILPIIGYIISTTLFLIVVVNVFYYKANETLGTTKTIIIRNVLLLTFVLSLNIFFTEILGVVLPVGIFGI